MGLRRRRFLQASGFGALALAFGGSFAEAAEPYRIGALNPVTGAGSPYGTGMQKSIIFSADEVNAAGGTAGRKLQIYAEDSQTSPEAGVLATKKLIEVNKVQAILGTWSSGVTSAILPLIENAGVILMTNSGASTIVSKKDLIFRFSAITERIGRVLGDLVAKEGYTRVATMAFDNASGREIASGAKEAWDAKGKKLVAQIVYEPNQPSYRSEIQRVLAANPQIIIMGSYVPDMTIIVREIAQSGAGVKLIAPGYAVTPKMIETLGPDATDGIMTIDYVSSLNSAAYSHFSKWYKAVVGSEVGDNYYASCAYDMAQVLGLAIEAAGAGADNKGILAAMRKVANPPGKKVSSFAEGKKLLEAGEKVNYEGASGPIDFDGRGDVTPLFKLSVVKNGKLEFLRMIQV
jgi:branched-chain amino acid transport system substrate-binding protein